MYMIDSTCERNIIYLYLCSNSAQTYMYLQLWELDTWHMTHSISSCSLSTGHCFCQWISWIAILCDMICKRDISAGCTKVPFPSICHICCVRDLLRVLRVMVFMWNPLRCQGGEITPLKVRLQLTNTWLYVDRYLKLTFHEKQWAKVCYCLLPRINDAFPKTLWVLTVGYRLWT